MRLQLVSDVHCEFHRDGGYSFVQSLDPAGIDVLVLAGDICAGEDIVLALGAFCSRYRAAAVVYVHGNHEFYGIERQRLLSLTTEATRRYRNLVWLDADLKTVRGQRILGAPLWFRRADVAEHVKRGMNDFFQIPQFESWVYEENTRALAFFERELREGDIVVTHHLPTQRSVAPRFAGHPLNPFFVCELDALIRERRPKLWLHGHTHDSVDVTVGETRVLANPFGYVDYGLNPEFADGLIVQI